MYILLMLKQIIIKMAVGTGTLKKYLAVPVPGSQKNTPCSPGTGVTVLAVPSKSSPPGLVTLGSDVPRTFHPRVRSPPRTSDTRVNSLPFVPDVPPPPDL